MLSVIEEQLDPNTVCEAVGIMDDKIHEAIVAFDTHEIPGAALDKALKIRDEIFEDLPAPWLKQLVTECFLFKFRERMMCDASHHDHVQPGRGRQSG